MKKSILCIISFFFFQIVSAYDIKVDDLYYNINKETKEAQVTFGPWGSYQYRSNEGEYSGSVIIPELISVEGEQYNVTSIDEVAFLKCPKLTDVFIPKTIKSIGIEAFEGCANLNTVTLSDGVCKIGELAFNGTDITNLVIPNSVDSIGSSAFINCKSL